MQKSPLLAAAIFPHYFLQLYSSSDRLHGEPPINSHLDWDLDFHSMKDIKIVVFKPFLCSFVLYTWSHCLAGTQIRFSSRISLYFIAFIYSPFTLTSLPDPEAKNHPPPLFIVIRMMWSVWLLFRCPKSSILVSSSFWRIFLQLVSHIPSVKL